MPTARKRTGGLDFLLFVSLSLSLLLSLSVALSAFLPACLSLSVTPSGPPVISEIFKPRPLITWLEKQDWFHRVPHQTPRLPKNLVNTSMLSTHASYEEEAKGHHLVKLGRVLPKSKKPFDRMRSSCQV